MSTSNNCTDAILAYAEEMLAEIAAGKVRIVDIADERWQRGLDGVARRQLVAHKIVLLGDRTGSSSYEKASQAVRDDVDFGPLVGGMIGSIVGTSRFDESTVIDGAIHALVNDQEGSVKEEVVGRKIAALRDYVKAKERLSTVVIPLPGLQSLGFPIELEGGLQIDVLTDDEVNACASIGILQPPFPNMAMLTAEECVGVRVSLMTPAAITEPGSEPSLGEVEKLAALPHRFGDRSPWRVAELAEDVLFVLRLARPEFIGTRGAVHLQQSHMGESRSWVTRPTRPMLHTTYTIDDETAVVIGELWGLLRTQEGTRSLPSICSRRFNAAMDRVSLEDAIVDHLIAAEALFLKDAGSPDDRGELGFRLALRASAFLEREGQERRPTFKFMKRAYDLRSTVSHGGSIRSGVSVPELGEVTLGQFVDDLGRLMREALRKAVGQYSSSLTFPTSAFWDELLLGPPKSAAD